MEIIKFKNKLKTVAKVGDITNNIVQKIQSIPSYPELKNDLELLLYICTVIENELINKKGKKHNKKETVIDILNLLYGISEEDKIILGKQIDFLHSNNLIKKLTNCEIITHSALNWINNKLL